jgi:tripartite-type tricarboxylate transporter receptor subunit TctC
MAAAPMAAHAQAYPTRPITIIVPFGPGSGTDIVTRIIAQPLGIALNQSIVIDNRVGANGGIAAAYVAKAPRTATRCSPAPTARIRPIRSCSRMSATTP